MRRGFALAWTLFTALIAGVSAYIAYGAGWAAGVATKVPDGAAAIYPPPYYYDYGWHPFGFIGFLFFLLIGFVFLRLLFFRGWYGRRFGHGSNRFEEWHRSQHEQQQPPTTTTV